MKRSILVLFWVFMSATMFAQGGIDVAGIVLDEQGQELIGCLLYTSDAADD